MKNAQFKSLGVILTILVPGTNETDSEVLRSQITSHIAQADLASLQGLIAIIEFDQLAKRSGAGAESAVNNEIYRGVLADFRSEFCERIEAKTNIKRKVKISGRTRKNDAGEEEPIEVYDESEGKYVDGTLAQIAKDRGVSELLAPVEFASILDEIMSAVEEVNGETKPLIRFDPTRAERKVGGPKKLPDVYRKAALAIQSKGKLDAFIKHYGVQLLPESTDEEKVEAVGFKMKQLEDAERKAQEALVADKYGSLV